MAYGRIDRSEDVGIARLGGDGRDQTTLDLRDREKQGHTQRVTKTILHLARAMGISEEELIHVHRRAMLHDIREMGVPDSIPNKPGPLTNDAREIKREPPAYAYTILSGIDYLRLALDIPYCHHEKWDGAGYPQGLKGKDIPLPARILSVVNVGDALRSD